MDGMSQAMERVTSTLYRTGDLFEEILSALGRRLPKRKLAQPYDGLLKGIVWLAAVVAIDRVAGHPSSLQLLYFVPAWIAFETAGLGVATCIATVVVPVSTLASPIAPWGTIWDFVVRLGMMVSLVAVMTFHGRRFRTTEESAQRDSLTGALNRAGFEAAARGAIESALAFRHRATVAVIDCDNFKDLNDVKGHAFGDGVLRTLVRILKSSMDDAIVGRTGGDEFVLVVPNVGEAEVRRRLKAALDQFTDATLILGRRSTFTYGLAKLGTDGMRYESLLESADRDMYRGKASRYQAVVDLRAPLAI